jgi:hypothetical protein
MATKDTRHRTTWGNRFRFLSRFVGLTGVLVFVAGSVMLGADPVSQQPTQDEQWARDVYAGKFGSFAQTAAWMCVGGFLAAVLAVGVEILNLLFLVTGRRTAAGGTAFVATVAAVVLLVCVNVYSFRHPARFDLTRDKQFTLPPHIADELRTLRPESPTTIVVFQQHKTFGTLSDKPDSYDYAAERKVVEKVKDLVERFREFGPRFNVVVLDVEEEGYEKQLDALTKDAPELKAAIAAAPENSIFFHANKRVQRLGFNEFLQLDKTASKAAHDGRGNLVLMPQGVESFARRIFAVQEKRPKVAVAVVHEWLTTDATEGQEQYSLAGLRKSLTDYGFDVVDVVLKKNWENDKPVEPAAYTKEETRLERLESELTEADDRVRDARDDAADLVKIQKALDETRTKAWRDRAAFYTNFNRAAVGRAWTELIAVFRKQALAGPLDENNDGEFLTSLAAGLKKQQARTAEQIGELERDRRAAEDKLKTAYGDERPIQDRRMTDIKAKFAKLLADVDLLVVPRLTVINVTIGAAVPGSLHALSKEQAEVIKDYMKSGRPVLACLGPLSGRSGFDAAAVDDFERLLADRGIELGKQTVLFEGEAKAFSARRAGNQLGGAGPADIPPLVVADAKNPVADAMRTTARSVEAKLDLRLRAPRPVSITEDWKRRMPFASEFLTTSGEAWAENEPFPRQDAVGRFTYVPRFDRTADDDAKKNTADEEKRGPFPIGVAVESRLPASWYDAKFNPAVGGVVPAAALPLGEGVDGPKTRLVVFGSATMFTGSQLKPAQEKLLLHSANWLVNRPDRLPKSDEKAWSFPRVDMTEREVLLWRGGTAVGLPLLAVYLGLVATMRRKVR